ncbi:solute carrier family 35 (probable UDP-sugar transporter), member A4 [Sarotherodon galilaeus]
MVPSSNDCKFAECTNRRPIARGGLSRLPHPSEDDGGWAERRRGDDKRREINPAVRKNSENRCPAFIEFCLNITISSKRGRPAQDERRVRCRGGDSPPSHHSPPQGAIF